MTEKIAPEESSVKHVDKAVVNLINDSKEDEKLDKFKENLKNESEKNNQKDISNDNIENKTYKNDSKKDKNNENKLDNNEKIQEKEENEQKNSENPENKTNKSISKENTKDNDNEVEDNLKNDNSSDSKTIKDEDKINFNQKIYEILQNYDDIYAIEYLLKELKINKKIKIEQNTLDKIYKFIKKYISHDQFIETGFNNFMLTLIKNFNIENFSIKILHCVSLLDIRYEWVNYYRHVVGYSKTYNNVKEAITTSFENGSFYKNNYNYLYVSYLIVLLDNDNLIYKNLKPLLKTLIRYIKNDIVEKNISVCAKITSAIAHGAPTLFTVKFVSSLLAYYTKVIFESRNYINLNLNDVVECINVLLESYDNIDSALITGLLREGIGKLTEFKNSTIKEEIKLMINTINILCNLFKIHSKNHTIEDYVKNYKKYAEPSFITKKRVNEELEKNKKDNENKREVELFLMYKYRYMDLLLKYHNCYDRIELNNDLKKVNDPGVIFMHFKNYSEYVDWNDFVELKITPSVIKYLFNDHFLSDNARDHKSIIKIFFMNVPSEKTIYFTKYASIKNCHFIVVDLYISKINRIDFEATRERQVVLDAINDVSVISEVESILMEFERVLPNGIYKEKGEEKDITEEGYKNILLFLIVLLSKVKNKKYSEKTFDELPARNLEIIKKFSKLIKSLTKPNNTYNNFYVAMLFYLDKDLHRQFYDYFDVILELMSIEARGLRKSEIQRFRDTTFPLMFQMTEKEIKEVGILYKNHKDSKFYKKYLDVLKLMEKEDKFKEQSEEDTKKESESESKTSEVFEFESASEDLSSSFIENAADHEKTFLKKQKEIIFEKYDLAQREKNLEQEKYDLAKKEHDLLRETREKISKAQRQLIKEKYKEAKIKNEEVQRQFERIKKEKEEIEKNFKNYKVTKTHNILEDNLKQAQQEHETAKEEFKKAKEKYKEGNQRYKDAMKDLDLLKEQIENHKEVTKSSNDISNNNIDENINKHKDDNEKILNLYDNKLTKEQKEMLENNDKLKEEGLVPKNNQEKQLSEFRKGNNSNNKNNSKTNNNVKNQSIDDNNSTIKNKNTKESNEEEYKGEYKEIFEKPKE